MAERQVRRTRDGIGERLIEAALQEFAAKGFDGASTRSIAKSADAHQPQINYHFRSKQALWEAAVDHLFGLLEAELDKLPSVDAHSADVATVVGTFAEIIRRFVRFAAAHPELNRIMVHEATAPGPRLELLAESYVRPLYEAGRALWSRLRSEGVAAPIDERIIHYVLVGSASLLYVNAPEARLLAGVEPTDPALVEAHADQLVATFLPGRHGDDRSLRS